ncbi:MAG TPA: CBS domain-containing protein [Pyrinomonadaceae bacterium]|nr:CBS domain-containing protein [Pyrinomonadaceae bacterium]
MPVSSFISKCVTECTEDTPIDQVYEKILRCRHGLVVVVDSTSHRVPIGIVSERSICENVILRGKSGRNLTAGSVMDPRIRTIRETDSLDPSLLADGQPVSAVVVVDEARRVCGIVPKNKLKAVDATVTSRSPGRVVVNVNERRSPAVREIPAFGWIQ